MSSPSIITLSGQPPRPRAFTLVELLAVLSIILLVVAFALPALTSLSKSSARRGGIALTMSALDEARALAIAQGGGIYVAFADGQAEIPEEYRYRSFAVFRQVYLSELKSSGKPYVFERLRPWTKLPQGVAFVPDAGSRSDENTIFSGARQKFYFRAGSAITPNGVDSEGVELPFPFLKFNHVGALESEGVPPLAPVHARMRLFEGYIAADGQAVFTGQARAGGTALVEVSLFTGRAQHREQQNAS